MNVLLTGATGLLGGELLVTLAQRPEIEKLHCLLRPRPNQSPLARLRAVFDVHGDPWPSNRKVVPVPLDLLDPELPARLETEPGLSDVDCVIHAAANTSFSPLNDELVRRVNVEGLERVSSWAAGLPRLRTFVYVGTATICGADAARRVVSEDESPNPLARHLVYYTRSKAEGELSVRRRLRSDQVLVVRPSIIMGDARGLAPRSPVVLWAMAAINRLRLLPVHPDAALDVVPVDYAAAAIVALLFANRRTDTYHVAAGAAAKTSTRELAAALTAHFGDEPPFRFVHTSLLAEIKDWAKGRLAPDSALAAYRTHLEYWERTFPDRQTVLAMARALQPYFRFMELGQVFDDSRLRRDAGLPSPEAAHVYMARSMQHLAAIDVLRGAHDP